MPAVLSVREARVILGEDVLGPDEVASALGGSVASPPIPFSRDQLVAARDGGELLVLRVTQAGDGASLTIRHMLQRFPQAFDQQLLRKAGYQLKDEWGIELEPLAAIDTCAAGWALVRKEILDDTRNLSYEQQQAALQRYAERLGASPATVRRRAGVEAVYDTVLYFLVRQGHLLEKSWDWSATRTVDGGYLNVGGFGAGGMQILSFSRAVRHGALGICPTRCAPA